MSGASTPLDAGSPEARTVNATTRRQFLSAVGLGATAVGLGARPEWRVARAGWLGARPESPAGMLRDSRVASSLKLGVASYSLRNFSRTYAIQAIQSLDTPYVNIKSFHLPYEMTPSALLAGRGEFEAAGLEIVGGGTVTLNIDTDEDVRSYFEYARASGMPLMVIAPTPETLPRIERFVREYDIAVAIHNHGPEDGHFPGPQDILPLIRDMDPRVGVCLDVGHAARTGIDVAEAAEMCGDRLLDMHVKDLADLSVKESQCIVGEGAMPIGRLFSALGQMGYQGFINLEYEIDASNPLPGMLRSFAYMRGVLEGISA